MNQPVTAAGESDAKAVEQGELGMPQGRSDGNEPPPGPEPVPYVAHANLAGRFPPPPTRSELSERPGFD